MSDTPWGVGDGAPMNEGSETPAVPEGNVGEQKAAELTADGYTGGQSRGDELEWGADEEAHPGPAEQAGQPNLTPQPPVAGHPTKFSPGATDDSPGTVS